MMAKWLRTPEAVRWWGDADEQLALVIKDLRGSPMRQWIVNLDGRPFAYVQAYPAHAWPQSHLLHLPAGSEAIDALIGEPSLIALGHGSRFLRLFAQKLIDEGASIVAIDPEVSNVRARRAYANAGFTPRGDIETADGPAMLMLYESQAGTR